MIIARRNTWLKAGLLTISAAARLVAQTGGSSTLPWGTDDEWERYRRVLQVSGDAPLYPWSVRRFGPSELARTEPKDTATPWSNSRAMRSWRYQSRWVGAAVRPVSLQFIENTILPFGYNDGAVWAGRGMTTVLQFGASGRVGPLSVSLAPLYFRAQNVGFRLAPNDRPDIFAYGDPFRPGRIDLPQRFGPGPYARLDPGQSEVRLDVAGLAAGFSTANEHWGPSIEHPMVLGNNAAGFAHVFVGTSKPLRLPGLTLHGRLVWGKLDESRYTTMELQERYRFATSLVAAVSPSKLPQLELGVVRFIQLSWTDSVTRRVNLFKPVGLLLKSTRVHQSGNAFASEPDNEIASVFARWVQPSSGLEIFGEFAREDNAWNLRDLWLEPDHMAGYSLGVQRVFTRDSVHRTAVHFEVLNTRVTSLALVRYEEPFYGHAPLQQGETHLGQALGSVGAYGGGALTFSIDKYSPSGRRSVSLIRIMRQERFVQVVPEAARADVQQALRFDGIRTIGRFGISYEMTGIYEANRNFAKDAFSVRMSTGVQYGW